MSDAVTPAEETFSFQAETAEVLQLVINSLYSNREIFLRELISNASDALDRLRFRAITEKELLGDQPELTVTLHPDAEARTLTVEDTGLGMTRDELIRNLGTIAHSGSRRFIEHLRERGSEETPGLIGQFGVGFYSSWLVAERVEVFSRAADSEETWKWSSKADGAFTVTRAEDGPRGTRIVLHLSEGQEEFAEPWRLRALVERYSDYVGHPIRLAAEEGEPETINRATALWQQPSTEITDEQAADFYRHLTNDWEDPLARTHFRVEGTQVFTGMLFIPGRAPFDLMDRDGRHGIRLYVRRVFIMEDCSELLPSWLRFVRGVIDSDDLPLNVSRELLQDSRIVTQIRKHVVKKVLDMVEGLAADPEKFATFTEHFGRVLKEGVHFEPSHKLRIAKLLRWEILRGDAPLGLEEYVAAMPEEQSAIYYALGTSRDALANGPHVEAIRERGWDVLLMTEGIDQWVVDALAEYDGRRLVSVMQADLALDGPEETADTSEEDTEKNEEKAADEKKADADAEAHAPLLEAVREVLAERVREVRLSRRLASSPACLVIADGAMHASIERMLRASGQAVPEQGRIFELNPGHPLTAHLENLREAGGDAFRDRVELLYDQARLTEGSGIADPAAFARRLTRLMEDAAAR